MRLVFLALFAASVGCDAEPPQPEDCIETLGDNCTCTPKCMTQQQYDAITDFCDLGCEPQEWECTVVDGQCAVVE